ncbi:hypothetical protein [Sphingobium aromaticiconvertens]|uniref:hypothetical protein n=1 Tax=Sphingobium aromaticiconvertens TaxID=365341 RepID=UPI00301A3610
MMIRHVTLIDAEQGKAKSHQAVVWRGEIANGTLFGPRLLTSGLYQAKATKNL